MPETRETWVRSLGQDDPLEEGMATHSRILVWRIEWTEGPGGLWSIGSQRVGTIPKKDNAKECSNYRIIALISHASKVILKILQAKL